jgi:hypothetical protein
VSTGYLILGRNPDSSDGVRLAHVVWSEEEAVEMVERLNALGSDSSQFYYFWQTTWVARRAPEQELSLTPDDRESLALAEGHGAINTERPVAVFFSFTFNPQGALAATKELQSLGWPDVGTDEESQGDGCWFVYAHHRRLVLTEESIRRLRAEMEELAERHGGKFDRWDISGSTGIRNVKPGELAT